MQTFQWSKWNYLAKCQPPPKKGVYKIQCIKNGKSDLITRANGSKNAILYIGKTDGSLKSRINTFWKAANEKKCNIKSKHTAGNTYVLYDFNKPFPLDNLQVQWKESDGPEDEEKLLLNEYKKNTLDIPPLNLQLTRIWE